MSNTATLLQPDNSTQQQMTINLFLSQSFDQAKKQLENGVSLIQDGVSFIKEELVSIYDKTGDCLNGMALPINNFLKDISQIDSEFQQQDINSSGQSMGCTIIPIEVALLSPMEENY